MARILIVDAYEPLLDMLRMLLTPHGHVVGVATDGPAALRLAGDGAFDLALIDMNLPGMDAVTVCAALRSHPGTRRMRVLMMTGRPGREAALRALCAGAEEVMAKPFGVGLLLEKIAQAAPARPGDAPAWAARAAQTALDCRA